MAASTRQRTWCVLASRRQMHRGQEAVEEMMVSGQAVAGALLRRTRRLDWQGARAADR